MGAVPKLVLRQQGPDGGLPQQAEGFPERRRVGHVSGPSIVSEELWDRANAIYKRRSREIMSHQSAAEFKQRNDGFNEQVKALEGKRLALQAEAEKGQRTAAQLEEIRTALEQELTFQNGINSAPVTAILDKIVVKKGSTKSVGPIVLTHS